MDMEYMIDNSGRVPTRALQGVRPTANRRRHGSAVGNDAKLYRSPIENLSDNMSKITIEHNPSEDRLKELGVAGWPIWEKEISKFPIDFDETETAYVLEGEIIVTPADGEPVRIVPGDLVSFHAGLDSQWEVVKPLRKHYSYDYPNGV
jgi:uncharacterized cupin superfamily protein